MKYDQLPYVVNAHLDATCSEFLYYQYLPIKMAGDAAVRIEDRLDCFGCIVGTALCDYVGLRGLNDFVQSYVYLTARHLVQPPHCSFNRMGWHADGFGTDDINYVWYDRSPTVFNAGPFELSADEDLSMVEMEQQANQRNNTLYPNLTLLRLNQFCIHRVASVAELMLRTFVKVSVSKDRYNLLGNSVNGLFDYNWPMRPRTWERNVPGARP